MNIPDRVLITNAEDDIRCYHLHCAISSILINDIKFNIKVSDYDRWESGKPICCVCGKNIT